jgi:hypothetical protein
MVLYELTAPLRAMGELVPGWLNDLNSVQVWSCSDRQLCPCIQWGILPSTCSVLNVAGGDCKIRWEHSTSGKEFSFSSVTLTVSLKCSLGAFAISQHL